MNTKVEAIVEKFGKDKTRLMDILLDIQAEFGFISDEAVSQISGMIGISQVDVEQTISFYHFFSKKPVGKYAIYLNDSVVANMMGREKVKEAFENEVGCKFGEVSSDNQIGLFDTSCIGMNDQEPAAIINNVIFTRLTPFRVKEIVADIKAGKNAKDILVEGYGGGKNSSDLLKSVVNNNIRKKGIVLEDNYTQGKVLKEALSKMSPQEVIGEITNSNLRGRGGAGFPTGMKWDFCRKSSGDQRFVICNADEGEPGTFKDRVILTEKPELVFEGMAIAGYAIGANLGILYLRYEYKYLQSYLETILKNARENNYLGKGIAGIEGFDFDIRIQFGAGAYVCGEESALIESIEGKRGEPRDRPPFPVEKGYLDLPTVVNNVETLCSAVKVLTNGADWYKSMGINHSSGTKILSISGDCKFPGIYEVEWGFKMSDVIDMAGAENVQAVQVGGPSGTLVGPNEFSRTLSYSDIATGGAMIIIGNNREILEEVVLNFIDFFIEESCGSCSTCRNVPVVSRKKLMKIIKGRGIPQDIEDLKAWGEIVKVSRCGLGQTSMNPILTSIKNLLHIYTEKVQDEKEYDSCFNMSAAVKDSCEVVDRTPII